MKKAAQTQNHPTYWCPIGRTTKCFKLTSRPHQGWVLRMSQCPGLANLVAVARRCGQRCYPWQKVKGVWPMGTFWDPATAEKLAYRNQGPKGSWGNMNQLGSSMGPELHKKPGSWSRSAETLEKSAFLHNQAEQTTDFPTVPG